MMRAPSEMRCRSIPNNSIATNTAASTSGIDERHHGTGAQAEADQADGKNDGDRLPQRLHEIVHRMLDGHGLVGDERRLDPDRQVRRDLGHRLGDVAPQGQNVAALAHGNGKPDALPAIDAEHRLRRIGGPARYMRDVAQPDDPVVGDEVDRQDVLLGPERARDADKDLLVPSLHDARGGNGVLRLQRRDQRGAVDAEAGQLLGRELHVHPLVLGPQDVDLRDVRQLRGAACGSRPRSPAARRCVNPSAVKP